MSIRLVTAKFFAIASFAVGMLVFGMTNAHAMDSPRISVVDPGEGVPHPAEGIVGAPAVDVPVDEDAEDVDDEDVDAEDGDVEGQPDEDQVEGGAQLEGGVPVGAFAPGAEIEEDHFAPVEVVVEHVAVPVAADDHPADAARQGPPGGAHLADRPDHDPELGEWVDVDVEAGVAAAAPAGPMVPAGYGPRGVVASATSAVGSAASAAASLVPNNPGHSIANGGRALAQNAYAGASSAVSAAASLVPNNPAHSLANGGRALAQNAAAGVSSAASTMSSIAGRLTGWWR